MQEEHVRPRRFVGIGKKVSLFLLSAVLGVIGVIILVGYKQGAFVRHTKIYFHTADAFGINKGTSVRLFGLPIGSVNDLDISDRGVKVELSIISDYTPRVPKTARARLLREGYIGAATIQIVPSGEPGHALQSVEEGDEIEYVPARGVVEMIDDFKTQLTPVINDMRKMIVELNQPNSDFRKSLAGANAVLQQLPETNREVRQAMHDADATLGSLGRVSAQLEQQLPVLTGKMATALDKLSETSEQIRDTTRKNGDALHEVLIQVPGLLRDGGELVRDGQDVVGAARNSWLLRDNFEVRSMRGLPVDSFESTASGAGAQR
jgi:phospholipid/cholesterol/gamma-HCH transport system substrate-binding protein